MEKVFVSQKRFDISHSLQKQPAVNLTNILHEAFALISFCQKTTNLNCKHIKGWQKFLLQKSCLLNVGEIVTFVL